MKYYLIIAISLLLLSCSNNSEKEYSPFLIDFIDAQNENYIQLNHNYFIYFYKFQEKFTNRAAELQEISDAVLDASEWTKLDTLIAKRKNLNYKELAIEIEQKFKKYCDVLEKNTIPMGQRLKDVKKLIVKYNKIDASLVNNREDYFYYISIRTAQVNELFIMSMAGLV